MNELIITNRNEIARLEPFIIEKFYQYGAGILDSRHPGFSDEEKYQIIHYKYWDNFVADALETGHFIESKNGNIKIALRTLNQDIGIIAGYIFEALTVRQANEQISKFGYKIFKWITARKKLAPVFYIKYQAIGVGFPTSGNRFPGYYNPNYRQFDVMFLTMNEMVNKPEPATIVNTKIPAGLQVKAITSNEVRVIIQPLIDGQYTNVITYLRHASGEHSYEVCMREIKRLYRDGKISYDDRRKLEDSIGYPEMFGLDQRDIDDYYSFVKAWYNKGAKEDEFILKGLGIQSQEIKRGSSFLTVL